MHFTESPDSWGKTTSLSAAPYCKLRCLRATTPPQDALEVLTDKWWRGEETSAPRKLNSARAWSPITSLSLSPLVFFTPMARKCVSRFLSREVTLINLWQRLQRLSWNWKVTGLIPALGKSSRQQSCVHTADLLCSTYEICSISLLSYLLGPNLNYETLFIKCPWQKFMLQAHTAEPNQQWAGLNMILTEINHRLRWFNRVF